MCKRCKQTAEAVSYRFLELSDDDKKRALTEHMIQRLLDPEDSLSWYVQDLAVSDYRGKNCHIKEARLETIITRFSRLQTFEYVIR